MSTTITPAEVFPAGDYLRDELEERGWTIGEFAEIIGRPVQAVSEILNDKKEITTETACALADALGTSPELWLTLQTNHRLHLARRAAPLEPSAVARRARLHGLVPVAKAAARGWLPKTADLDQLEAATQAFLELDDLNGQPTFAMAARRSNSDEPITAEQIAWLAHVRSVARLSSAAAPFDRTRLDLLAADLPRLTAPGPQTLCRVPGWFAECGVVVVFSEGLPGGKLDGAVSRLADGRPIIGLTTRGDRFDSVLFTLLHEAAHLALGHLAPEGNSIVDVDLDAEQANPIEREANDQARAWLFPADFTIEANTMAAVQRAATHYGVHESVVIGQLQRQTGDWRRHRKYVPKVRPVLAAAGLLS